MILSWEEAQRLSREIVKQYRFLGDYSLSDSEKELVFKYAQEIPKGGIAVELGVAYGETAAVICYTAKYKSFEYHGIDDFSLCGSYAILKSALENLSLPGIIHTEKTENLSWDRGIDFLLIDAGHDEKSVRQDCEKWIRFVKKGGIVLFHDYVESADRSHPHWAVKHYGDIYTTGWEELEYLPGRKGLKILRRPDD